MCMNVCIYVRISESLGCNVVNQLYLFFQICKKIELGIVSIVTGF